jgi:hypothetical protein
MQADGRGGEGQYDDSIGVFALPWTAPVVHLFEKIPLAKQNELGYIKPSVLLPENLRTCFEPSV